MVLNEAVSLTMHLKLQQIFLGSQNWIGDSLSYPEWTEATFIQHVYVDDTAQQRNHLRVVA